MIYNFSKLFNNSLNVDGLPSDAYLGPYQISMMELF